MVLRKLKCFVRHKKHFIESRFGSVVAAIFAKSDARDALRHLCELEVSECHYVILFHTITTIQHCPSKYRVYF